MFKNAYFLEKSVKIALVSVKNGSAPRSTRCYFQLSLQFCRVCFKH